MALNQFHDRDASFFRNRSSSFSSPTTRGFLYEEVLTIGDNALVRSFSCGQVLAQNESGATTYTTSTRVHISNFISPTKKTQQLVEAPMFWSQPKVKPRTENIPRLGKARMALTFSDEKEDSEKKEATYPPRSKMAKNIVKMMVKIMKGTVYVNVVVLAVLIAAYVPKYRYCRQSWDVDEVVGLMNRTVFGQGKAVSRIGAALREFGGVENGEVVVAFSGGTGVGKTFVSSIIQNSFPWYSNSYVTFFDASLEENLLSKEYASCGGNLMVVDGLNRTTASSAVKSLNKLLRLMSSSKRKLLVILIFHTLHLEEDEVIARQLDQLLVSSYHHIHFGDLSYEDVKHCFEREFEAQKKTISSVKLERLVMSQMKVCNVSKTLPNCKKVFHEVSHYTDNG